MDRNAKRNIGRNTLANTSAKAKAQARNRRTGLVASAAAASAAMLTGNKAFAANGADTWQGTTDANWATSTNWTGTNKPPISGDSLVFTSVNTSGSTLTNTLTTSAFNVNGITFNSGSPAYTLGGNTFNLTSGVTNSSSNLQTLNEASLTTSAASSTYSMSTGGITITNPLVDSQAVTNQAFTVNGAGSTLTLGGYTFNALTAGTSNTATFSGTGNVTITGNVSNGATNTKNSIQYSGTGTLTLQGTNNYGQTTNAYGGTIIADFSTGNTPVLNNGTSLQMGGGTYDIKLAATGALTDAFYQTQINANTSSAIGVIQNGNTNTGTVFDLGKSGSWGTVTASTVDFTLPTAGSLENTSSKTLATNGVITTAANGGLAFATANGGANFASINTSTGVIGAVTPVASTYGATANTLVGSSDAPASAVGANSLTFASSGNKQVTFTGTNAITTGGILLSSTATGTTNTITGGNLEAGSSGKTLQILAASNANLTISSVIVDNGGASALNLMKVAGSTGSGTLTLTNANTFTGGTTINSGALNLSNQLALQNSTLTFNSGNSLVFDQSVVGNAFTLGGLAGNGNIALQNNAGTPAAVALTVGGNNAGTNYSGVLSGAGSLTKTGTGTSTLSGANLYSGPTVVNGGILYLGNAATIKSSSSVTVTGTGLLGMNQGSESGQFAAGVVITGTGGVANEINNPNTTITLDRANTYTGQTTWGARGIISAGVASTYDGSGNQTSGAFGVNSAIVFAAAPATLNLNGNNNQVGSLAGSPGNGGGVQLHNATLTIGGDNTSTIYTGPISDNYLLGTDANGTGSGTQGFGGNVVKIGTGTQTIVSTGNTSSYEGTTTIKGGVLSINVLGTSGYVNPASAAFTSGSSTVTVSSTAGLVVGQNVFDIPASTPGTTITAINSSTSITLSNTVGFSGTRTNVPFGFGSGIGISGPAASNLVLDGGTLQYTGAVTSTDRLFTIGQSTDTGAATGTLSASGTGALTFSNAGSVAYGKANLADTLTLTGTSTAANTMTPVIGNNGSAAVLLSKTGAGTWVLAGANTYTGATTVSAGTLKAGVASVAGVSGAFGNNSAVTLANVAGAGMDITGFDTQVGSLAGGGGLGGNVTLGSNTLTTGGDGTSPSYSGAISGNGGLTKIGTGTQTLAGTNGYTGATSVANGTLNVTGSLASGSAVTVGNTTTGGLAPTLTGTGTVGGPVSVLGTSSSSAGQLTPGSTTAIGNLATGALTFAAGSVLNELLGTGNGSTTSTAGSTAALTSVNGTLTLPSSGQIALNLSELGGGAFQNGTYKLFGYTAGLANASGSSVTSAFSFTAPSGKSVSLTDTGTTGTGEIDLTIQNAATHTASAVFATGSGAPAGYTTQFVGTSNPGGTSPSSTITVTSPTAGSVVAGYLNNVTSNPAGAGPKQYVQVNGFQNSDTEVVALGLTVTDGSGTHEITQAELDHLVADLNAADPNTILAERFSQLGTAGGVLSAGESANGGQPLDLAFVLSGGLNPGSPQTFGVDFSGEVGSGNPDGITAIAVTDIAVVPEPTSLGLLGLGALGVMGRRRRRNASDKA